MPEQSEQSVIDPIQLARKREMARLRKEKSRERQATAKEIKETESAYQKDLFARRLALALISWGETSPGEEFDTLADALQVTREFAKQLGQKIEPGDSHRSFMERTLHAWQQRRCPMFSRERQEFSYEHLFEFGDVVNLFLKPYGQELDELIDVESLKPIPFVVVPKANPDPPADEKVEANYRAWEQERRAIQQIEAGDFVIERSASRILIRPTGSQSAFSFPTTWPTTQKHFRYEILKKAIDWLEAHPDHHLDHNLANRAYDAYQQHRQDEKQGRTGEEVQ